LECFSQVLQQYLVSIYLVVFFPVDLPNLLFVLIEPETITTVDDCTVKSRNAHMRLIYARTSRGLCAGRTLLARFHFFSVKLQRHRSTTKAPSATRAAAAIRGTSGRPRPRLGYFAQGYTDNRNILRMNERNADRRKHILGRTLLLSLVLEFSI
jgi:hypothetical protein